MTTKTKHQRIENPEAIISEIQKQPAAELDALRGFLSFCETRKAYADVQTSIQAELEGERAAARIADFERVPVEVRAVRLCDSWVAENALELVALLRGNLAEKTKAKDGFLQSIGKRVAAISLEMFAPARDRDKLAAEREKAEETAAEIEAAITSANHSIRRLEIEPSLATYREAAASVGRVDFPLVSSGS